MPSPCACARATIGGAVSVGVGMRPTFPTCTLLAVVALVALATSAMAVPCPPSGPAAAGGAMAPPGGQIDIEGSGVVRLNGSFLAWGTVTRMDLVIEDRGRDGVVRVGRSCRALTRDKRHPGTRRVRISSPRSRFSIEGSRIRLTIRGRGSLAIAITGRGRGELDGVGTYRVNGGAARTWPVHPINLALGPAPARGPG